MRLTKSFTTGWSAGLGSNTRTSKDIVGTIKAWKSQKGISGSTNKKPKLKGVEKLKNTESFNKKQKFIN